MVLTILTKTPTIFHAFQQCNSSIDPHGPDRPELIEKVLSSYPNTWSVTIKRNEMKSNIPNKLFRFNLWHRLIEDIKLLFSLIKDYYNGVYREVSIGSIIVFIFAIVYVLFPADILPDVIPVIGQIDDAAVLLICLYFLEKDLYRYKEWKNDSG